MSVEPGPAADRPARPVGDADPVTQAWWDAASAGRLTVQRCRGCGAHQHYPRALCTTCSSTDLELVEVAGTGKIHSCTVVHRAPHPFFEPPYVVALVELDEGPIMMTNVVGGEVADVAIDQRVTVVWEDLPDGRRLPLFERC